MSTVTPLSPWHMWPQGRGVAARPGSGMATYRVLVGIDYAGKRVEPGDIVSDLPGSSIAWLSEQNVIEPVDNASPEPSPSKQRERKSPSKGDE